MNSQLREQAIRLRVEKNFSYGEIRKRLNVPKSTLSYWLREFPISEERILELRRQGWKKAKQVGNDSATLCAKRKNLKTGRFTTNTKEDSLNFQKMHFLQQG